MRIDLGLDTRLETSTQEDLDYIQANFREGERMEQEAVEAGHDTLDLFEQCFTVWYKDERIGYCGIMLQPGQTILSPSRFVAYMSCENANRHKFYYVKQSRKVLKAVVDQVQPWVSEFQLGFGVRHRGVDYYAGMVARSRNFRSQEDDTVFATFNFAFHW